MYVCMFSYLHKIQDYKRLQPLDSASSLQKNTQNTNKSVLVPSFFLIETHWTRKHIRILNCLFFVVKIKCKVNITAFSKDFWTLTSFSSSPIRQSTHYMIYVNNTPDSILPGEVWGCVARGTLEG